MRIAHLMGEARLTHTEGKFMRIAMRQYSAWHAELGESGFAPTENIKIGIQYFIDMIRNLFVQKRRCGCNASYTLK